MIIFFLLKKPNTVTISKKPLAATLSSDPSGIVIVVKIKANNATSDKSIFANAKPALIRFIKAPLAIETEVKEGFSAVILKDKEFPFELDNEYGVETSETILELFPVLIDSTLTLKEFYK